MRYYIISGEASGDLHGANLVKQLKIEDPNADFRGWGGDLMRKEGLELVKHYKELAFMGFVEVLMNIFTILKNLKFCKEDILKYQPDVVILIDYPGFNLKVAEFAKKNNIKVIYYISPQVWAWKASRVKKIKAYVDKMLVILPFEKEFYQKYNYEVDFVGHPLLDAISESEKREEKTIALIPGSRKQEIKTMLPIMLEATSKFDGYRQVIAGVNSIDKSFYQDFIEDSNAQIEYNAMHNVLRKASIAVVTSGTATLETALFNVPQVVCYKGSFLSYHIGKHLVKVKYISLVNLIMDQEVVKELIQNDLSVNNLRQEAEILLKNAFEKEKMYRAYEALQTKLGGKGASERAAKVIVDYLNE